MLRKDISKILESKAEETSDFFFIQIGSGDGKKTDPIYDYVKKYKWKGILIEPVKSLYDELKRNYKGFEENLAFRNIAIDVEEGYKDFYRISNISNNNVKKPFWYDQIGSLDKEIVLKHKDEIPGLEENLLKEKIRCISLNQLFKQEEVKKVNLLHLDVEGYDYKIIRSINFNFVKPDMILYEHKHLGEYNRVKCMEYLFNRGYVFIVQGDDTFAYKKA